MLSPPFMRTGNNSWVSYMPLLSGISGRFGHESRDRHGLRFKPFTASGWNMSTGEMQHERGSTLILFCVSVPQAGIIGSRCTQMNGIWLKALMKNRFSGVWGLQQGLL